jgi:hypothetical protein
MAVVVSPLKGHYSVTFANTDVNSAGLVAAPGVKAGDIVQTIGMYTSEGGFAGGVDSGPFAVTVDNLLPVHNFSGAPHGVAIVYRP